MNEKKNSTSEMMKLLKLYSDSEIVTLINTVKLDYGYERPEGGLSYEDYLIEMERRGVDCSHVNDYDGYLNEIVIELKVIAGKKRLFANWMLLLNEDDYTRYIEQYEKDDLENEDEL